jgi:hypothetical protein
MRRLDLLAVIALAGIAACQQPETGANADTTPVVAQRGTSIDAGQGGWLGDTTRTLLPAPGATARLEVDPDVPQGTAVASDEPATPLCPTGLRDRASGLRLQVVRSMQQIDKPLSGKDSTVWGRADYRPNTPEKFGLAPGQLLRVNCGTRQVLGIAPDIATATGAP